MGIIPTPPPPIPSENAPAGSRRIVPIERPVPLAAMRMDEPPKPPRPPQNASHFIMGYDAPPLIPVVLRFHVMICLPITGVIFFSTNGLWAILFIISYMLGVVMRLKNQQIESEE